MKQIDNTKPEEFSNNIISNGENISLKKNSFSEEETEEIDTRTCFQKNLWKNEPRIYAWMYI